MKSKALKVMAIGLTAAALVNTIPAVAFADEMFAEESMTDHIYDGVLQETYDGTFDSEEKNDYSADIEEYLAYSDFPNTEETASEPVFTDASSDETEDDAKLLEDLNEVLALDAAAEAEAQDQKEGEAAAENAAKEEAEENGHEKEAEENAAKEEAEENAAKEEAEENAAKEETAEKAAEEEAAQQAAEEEKAENAVEEKKPEEADKKAEAVSEKEAAEKFEKPEDYSSTLSGSTVETKKEEEKSKRIVDDYINAGHTIVNETVEATAAVLTNLDPLMGFVVNPVKGIILGSINKQDDLGAQIKDLRDKMDRNAEDIRKYTENTVEVAVFGNSLDDLKAHAKTALEKIKTINDNSTLTEEEKLHKIAMLYDTEYSSVEADLYKVTDIFRGKSQSSLKGSNLYDVVYQAYVKDSMFTGEVLDKSAPYLYEAISRYVNAHEVLDLILTAKEKTEGRESTKTSREEFESRFLGTIDKNGDRNKDGILLKYKEFFSQDRCVFIDKGEKNMKLNQDVLVFDANNQGEVSAAMKGQNMKDLLAIHEMSKALAEHLKGLKLKGSDGTMTEAGYLTAVGFKYKNISSKSVMTPEEVMSGMHGCVFGK